MVLVDSNHKENLKNYAGTGAIKLTPDNEVVRVGGVKYTISNGVIYDVKALLKEVKNTVDKAKLFLANGSQLRDIVLILI